MNLQSERNRKHPYLGRMMEIAMVVFLALYPLRHIHIGLDLWDTGYNYANFEYMGLDSMDSMWLFSTYIANFVGHMMTLLPFGKTLLAMNFYTGLTVSFLAVASYIACTRIFHYGRPITFIGEFFAISLCWCPTALLYNYLTYIFMLLAVIALYYGLAKNKRRCLFIAGFFLGLNVFVRFSNLPEVAFIFAVWAYSHLEVAGKFKDETPNVKRHERKLALTRALNRTFWCVLGYLSVVFVMLCILNITYGFGSYFDAIRRLFAMTDNARDYTAKSMLLGLVKSYQEGGYWLIRIAFFAVCGVVLCAIGKHIDREFSIKDTPLKGIFEKNFSFLRLAYLFSIVFAVCSLLWLYRREFLFNEMGGYGSILLPGMVISLIIVITCIVRIAEPQVEINEKLQAGLVLIIVLITPIGSNNGLFPVFNNLFLVAPFFVSCIWRFMKIKEWDCIGRDYLRKYCKDKKGIYKVVITVKSYLSLVPVKIVLGLFLTVCSIQFVYFGHEFVFTEAHNSPDRFYTMEENRTLSGIRMDFDKAYDLYGLYEYVSENDLVGKESLVYGYCPAISFYLQMPPAFNAWVDLRSYSVQEMEIQIQNIADGSTENYPVIITTGQFIGKDYSPEKWALVERFMEFGNYTMTYTNGTYTVYEAGK